MNGSFAGPTIGSGALAGGAGGNATTSGSRDNFAVQGGVTDGGVRIRIGLAIESAAAQSTDSVFVST
jgi:hypothetical protein